MDQNPDVVTIQQPAAPKKRISLKLLIITAAIILTLGLSFFTLLLQFNPKLFRTAKIQSSSSTSPTNQLESFLKTTFPDSTEYKEITNLTNLAFSEKDPRLSYGYYKKLYTQILQTYSATKNPTFKLALQRVKQYSKVYPQFKDTDFPPI